MLLNVICARTGQKYSPDYVYKLKNMVSRHLKQGHNFYCLTENHNQLPNIDTIHAPISISGPWYKIGLFHAMLPKIKKGSKCLFIDLDVVITGSLDNLIWNKKGFWIIDDWVRDTYNSSVMYWEHGTLNHIFSSFKPKAHIKKYRGDQDLITQLVPDAKTFKQEDILSYKFSGLVNGKDEKPKAKVVVFHGKPKMHDLSHVNWINQEWR